MASARNEFADYVVEMMAAWAPVSARRMFGGHGLYREGLMFALIADERLYFKADAGNIPKFEQAGSQPFTYRSATRTVTMSYWSAPESCLESPDEMRDWCRLAYGAALAGKRDKKAAGKPAKKRTT